MSRRRRNEEEFNRAWGDLANYNTEKAHGILHDSVTDERMAQKQLAYDAWMLQQPTGRVRRWRWPTQETDPG